MKVLITGGAGFIGCNMAEHFLKKGNEVAILDNFSRKGTRDNAKWLKEQFPKLKVVEADIRTDHKEVQDAVDNAEAVYHLAGQTAVTTSVKRPREDFECNVIGTFNVLEAVRASKTEPILMFSSTNKVYGGMGDVVVIDKGNKYDYRDYPDGIPENRLLDFHSPYGCSNGAAEQYVRDYARIYGLRTVVFRQSCIYGKRQFGIEDQGWIAWFTIASLLDKAITIYGNGKQVRDVLYVDDLINAYEMATTHIDKTKGKIYNVGGGKDNTLSLLELLAFLEKFLKKKIKYSFGDWRPGDQPVYISDIRKAKEEFGWEPKIGVEEGVKRIAEWVVANKKLFE